MAKSRANPGTLKKVLGYIGRYKLLLPVSLLFALLTVALTLYIPVIIGEAIDIIGETPIDFSAIIELFTLGAVLIGLTALFQWLMSTINNKISYSVVRDLRRDAFRKIEKLPLSYLDRQSRGDIVNRVINDADQFSEGLLLGFTQMFTGILTIVGTLAFMIYMNWIVAIVVVVLTPISLVIAKYIATHTYSMFRLRSECEGAETSYIEESISNQKLIKAFAHEDEAIARFDELNGKLSKSTLRAIFYSSLTNPTTRFVYSIVYAAVALTGAIMAIHAKDGSVAGIAFSVGQLASLLSYANQYTKPFIEISGVITEFQNSLACASRVFELIDEVSEIPDRDDAKVLEGADGNIDMIDVSFSYTPEKPLLEHVNVSTKPGERIAIVGPTGCGKTTLINLLMRFYDVNSGQICVEGNNKQFLDVIGTFVMEDDSGLLCDAYNTTELGEKDCTRITIMDKNRFDEWLKERKNSLKTISDF